MTPPRAIGRTRQTPTSGPLIGPPHPIGGQGHAARVEPPSDQVSIVTANGSHILHALLGEDGAKMADDSYGGWEAVDVPGQRARPVWRGVGAPTMELSLLFDGFRQRRSVEPECAVLEAMAGLTSGFEENEPPKLRLYGAGLPHSHARNPHYRWVIATLAWADPVIRQPHPHASVAHIGHRARKAHQGARVRQGVALTLMLADDIDAIDRLKPRKQHPKTRHTKVTHHFNTYRKIAKHELGTPRLGRKLADFNGDRDSTKPLKVGRTIKLPSRHLEDKWKRELRRHGRDG